MTDKNTGGPAFPCEVQEPLIVELDGETRETTRNVNMPGMTLRAYFAAKAMRALMGSHGQTFGTDLNNPNNKNRDCALIAYAMADAMLEARQS